MKIVKRVLIIIFSIILMSPLLIVLRAAFWDDVVAFFTPVPRPQITYGEFPFTLVYENEGEVITVSDVYVCKFDGFKIDLGDKWRYWKGYLKSNGDKGIFLKKIDNVELYISLGYPGHYMGDETNPHLDILHR